jgi:putative hemolysin
MKQIFGQLGAVAVLLCSVGLLAGCQAHHDDNNGSTQRVRPLRIPNPAALYCTKKGGTITMEHQEGKGQVSYCHLPDGTVMEEWALFRRDNPKPAAN